MLLGIWSRTDDKALADVKEAVNADYIARSFQEAAAIILEEATAGHRTQPIIQSTPTAKPELVRQLVAKDSVQGSATEH
jgi:hypothetical protein